MINRYLQREFLTILFKAIAGDITIDEMNYLNQSLRNSEEAMDLYLDFIDIHAGLNHISGSLDFNHSDSNSVESIVDFELKEELLSDFQ